MDTLEQRVERLERSCRRWRVGFLILLSVAAAGAAEGGLKDAQFANLTVRSLTIRSQPAGPFLKAVCDDNGAYIKLASSGAGSILALDAGKNSADLYLSRNTAKGSTSATLSADDVSGLVNLRTADGKNREIEPQ